MPRRTAPPAFIAVLVAGLLADSACTSSPETDEATACGGTATQSASIVEGSSTLGGPTSPPTTEGLARPAAPTTAPTTVPPPSTTAAPTTAAPTAENGG